MFRKDFGVAQKIGVEGSAQIRGTFMYMAPEILISRRYDKRVDLWSIGVILYGLLEQQHCLELFETENYFCVMF